ncbi:MAG: hypothetical protein LBE84_02000 [Planctomycetota bacterium]|jgi:hypothetical protein|nr:hypothetical protein [Planctomycetota bacterium]
MATAKRNDGNALRRFLFLQLLYNSTVVKTPYAGSRSRREEAKRGFLITTETAKSCEIRNQRGALKICPRRPENVKAPPLEKHNFRPRAKDIVVCFMNDKIPNVWIHDSDGWLPT